MRVVGCDLIEGFKARHSSSRRALDRWLKLMRNADFSSPQELRDLFGRNVDFVGRHCVFDVGGNKVRAITVVQFGLKIVIVTHVLTHSQYDLGKWKD